MRSPCTQEPFNEEDGIKAVHEAYARGINYFDTSPYYGNLQSEKAGAPMLYYKLWHDVLPLIQNCFCITGLHRCRVRRCFLPSGARNGSEDSTT